jgi:hypothetical protein
VVVDHANQPVSDAYVEVARDDGEERGYSWQSERVLTRPDGSFRVTGLPDAKLAVRAYRPGTAETVVAGVLLGERPRIVLPRTGTLAGVVVDTTGAPAEDVHVEAKDRARGEYRSERLFRTRGRFALRDLPAGTYQIVADDDPRSAITVTLAEGQTRDDVRIAISQRYALRGRLVDKARKPLAGWKLDVPHLHATFTTSSGRTVTTSTDELAITGTDGSFLLQHIAGDSATISARDPRDDGKAFEIATIPLRGPPTIDVGELVVDR